MQPEELCPQAAWKLQGSCSMSDLLCSSALKDVQSGLHCMRMLQSTSIGPIWLGSFKTYGWEVASWNWRSNGKFALSTRTHQELGLNVLCPVTHWIPYSFFRHFFLRGVSLLPHRVLSILNHSEKLYVINSVIIASLGMESRPCLKPLSNGICSGGMGGGWVSAFLRRFISVELLQSNNIYIIWYLLILQIHRERTLIYRYIEDKGNRSHSWQWK